MAEVVQVQSQDNELAALIRSVDEEHKQIDSADASPKKKTKKKQKLQDNSRADGLMSDSAQQPHTDKPTSSPLQATAKGDESAIVDDIAEKKVEQDKPRRKRTQKKRPETGTKQTDADIVVDGEQPSTDNNVGENPEGTPRKRTKKQKNKDLPIPPADALELNGTDEPGQGETSLRKHKHKRETDDTQKEEEKSPSSTPKSYKPKRQSQTERSIPVQEPLTPQETVDAVKRKWRKRMTGEAVEMNANEATIGEMLGGASDRIADIDNPVSKTEVEPEGTISENAPLISVETNNEEESAEKKRTSRKSKSRKLKLRRNQNGGKEEDNIFSNINKTPDDFSDQILSANIHGADALVPDPKILAPIVRMHILDGETGLPLSKSCVPRAVTSVSDASTPHLLSVLTRPFSLYHHRTMAPSWNEELILNEEYLHIVKPGVIVFFEILEARKGKELAIAIEKGKFGPERSWSPIAWAFLQLVGGNGKVNIEQKTRLQLYRFPELPKFQFSDISFLPHYNTPASASPLSSNPLIPHVFRCYRYVTQRKTLASYQYPSTLYVTLSARESMNTREVFGRAMLPTDVEVGRKTLDELLEAHQDRTRKEMGKSMFSLVDVRGDGDLPKWRRLDGGRCRLPNRPKYRLHAGTGGGTAVSFSPSGLFLAAACNDQSFYPIKLISVLTGERLATLEGHQDLVYELSWSNADEFLLSASSDGSVRIWELSSDVGGDDDASVRLAAVLQHPSFVYTAQWHPEDSGARLIATGSYDCQIRLWSFDPATQQTSSIQKLTGHESHVNSLVFEKDGTRIYSGDGMGVVRVWSSRASTKGKYECVKIVTLFAGSPISNLEMFPSGRQLLVQTLTSMQVYDVRLSKVAAIFHGYQLTSKDRKACVSPCGSYVICGTPFGATVWHSTTGTVAGKYDNHNMLPFSRGPGTIAWHPWEHMVAWTAFGEGGTFLVNRWETNGPEIEQFSATGNVDVVSHESLVTRRKSKAKESTSTPTDKVKRTSKKLREEVIESAGEEELVQKDGESALQTKRKSKKGVRVSKELIVNADPVSTVETQASLP